MSIYHSWSHSFNQTISLLLKDCASNYYDSVCNTTCGHCKGVDVKDFQVFVVFVLLSNNLMDVLTEVII